MKREKKEKKTFILAVPTIIVIIVFLIAMPIMIYQKNYKPLSREDALSLSEKILSIDNISCEIITKSEYERLIDYKFKDNVLYSKYNDSIELTNGNNENNSIYIDTKAKEKFIYISNNNIENFKGTLNAAIEILSNDDYEYNFIKYEKVNGIKAATVELEKDDSEFVISLDRETGMPIKIIGKYNTKDEENTSTITTVYRYQIGQVKDDDLKLPDTEGYNVTEVGSTNEKIGE